jgi:hypothetical protein
MSRFWKNFACLFMVLLLFFALANLVGFVRPMGFKPFRFVGFPFVYAEWGVGIKEFFDLPMLVANAAIAVGMSALLAWACSFWRCRAVREGQPDRSAQSVALTERPPD